MSNLVVADRSVTIRAVHVGPMDNVGYVVACQRTGALLLVDAADEPDALLAALAETSLDVGQAPAIKVVTTHHHRDHVQGLARVVAETGATTAAGRADAPTIVAETGVSIDLLLDHGDSLDVGHLTVDVIGLRGHTEGSIALALTLGSVTYLCTGDSLFPGGVGATRGDPARFQQLIDDVEARVFARYSDETLVLPGHGLPTTLGNERPALAVWRERGW